MRRLTLGAGALSLGFALACSGGSPIPAPAPAPAPASAEGEDGDEEGEDGDEEDGGGEGEDGDGEADEPGGDADGSEHSCCVYSGPLGQTHALVDDEKACTDDFGDEGGEFVTSGDCEPVCCKYATDAADVSKGMTHDVVARGNCALRKGDVVESGPDTCEATGEEGEDEAEEKPTPRPPPRPGGKRLTRPGSEPSSGGRNRPSQGSPKPGRLTRPAGR